MRMCLISKHIIYKIIYAHPACFFFLGGDPNPSRYDDLVQDDSNALAILDDYFTGFLANYWKLHSYLQPESC